MVISWKTSVFADVFSWKKHLQGKKKNSETQLDHGTRRSHHGDLAQSFRVEAPKIHPWNPQKKRTQSLDVFGFQLLSCWRIQNVIFHISLFFSVEKIITSVRENPSCTHVYHAQRRPFQLRECLARLVRRRFHWDENFNTENVRNKKKLQKQSKSPCFS